MTAFYMFRLMGMTFWGPSRVDPEKEHHIHESPPSMTRPLILLAIPAVFLGLLIGFPPESGLLHTWLAPIFEAHHRGQRPDRGGLQLLRHRWRAGDRDHGPGGDCDRPGLAALRRQHAGPGPARPTTPRSSPRDQRPARPGLLLPRLIEQVVVRRPQQPAVRGLGRQARGRRVLVRPDDHRRHGQRHRRRDHRRRRATAPRPDGPRSRTTPSASPSA